MRVPDHRQMEVFTVIGNGANDGVTLFFVEAEFGGRAISSGHERSHSRDLAVRVNGGVREEVMRLQRPFERSWWSNLY